MNVEALDQRVDRAAAVLKAMSNANRLRILCRLGAGECSVGELSARVGLSQSALSQHLARLRGEGLVAFRRQSQAVFYALASEEVRRLMATLIDLYCAAPDDGRSGAPPSGPPAGEGCQPAAGKQA